MHRSDYVIKRVLFALVTVFVAITINFFLFRVLPGNAVTEPRRASRTPRPQLQQALEEQFGLDKPKWEQYLIYLQQLAARQPRASRSRTSSRSRENLRDSAREHDPDGRARHGRRDRVGVLTGVLSAWRRGTQLDHVSTNSRSCSTRSRPSGSGSCC